MSDNENKSCYNCEHYISSVGEKGYCKLYRHETTLPEKPCPRFEPKSSKQQDDVVVVAQKKTTVEKRINNILLTGAFFASTIITVIGMMFSFNLSMSVLTVDKISPLFKIITLVVSVALVLLLSYILFILGRKYKWARIAEIVIALIVVCFILAFSNAVFETFSNYILSYIEILIV